MGFLGSVFGGSSESSSTTHSTTTNETQTITESMASTAQAGDEAAVVNATRSTVNVLDNGAINASYAFSDKVVEDSFIFAREAYEQANNRFDLMTEALQSTVEVVNQAGDDSVQAVQTAWQSASQLGEPLNPNIVAGVVGVVAVTIGVIVMIKKKKR